MANYRITQKWDNTTGAWKYGAEVQDAQLLTWSFVPGTAATNVEYAERLLRNQVEPHPDTVIKTLVI